MSALAVALLSAFMIGALVGMILAAQSKGHGKGDIGANRRVQRDLRGQLGEKAVRDRARFTRPTLDDLRTAGMEELSVSLGSQVDGSWPRRELSAHLEDSHIVIGNPGSGKTLSVKKDAVNFPGAVVFSSTKFDIVKHTHWRRRRKFGHVEIFNPDGIGPKPSTLKWNLVRLCRDPEGAIQMAAYLLSGTSAVVGGGGDREFWNSNANKVLRALLFVAAHYELDLFQVKRWANHHDQAQEAVKLLHQMGDRAPSTWADELSQILNSYDRFKGSVFATLAMTFDFLRPGSGTADIVTVGQGDRQFDAHTFLTQRGTLYLLAEQKDAGSIAPLFCALTGYIYDTAKRLGQATGDRLDPPVLFLLDECANIVPLPLHRMTAQARGLGITFIVCIQAYAQLEEVWGKARGRIIWASCKIKRIFPGDHDDEFLEMISKLCGEYRTIEVTKSRDPEGRVSTSEHPVSKRRFPVDKLRMLPDMQALVLYGNKPAFVVAVSVFWEEKKRLKAEARERVAEAGVRRPPPRPPTRGGTPAPEGVPKFVELRWRPNW